MQETSKEINWGSLIGGIVPGYLDYKIPPPLVHHIPEEYSKLLGIKHDNNKPRMDLIDPEFLVGLAKVLTFGAKKYDAHNWRNGIQYSRLIAAAYRHLGTINGGEDLDSESNLPHVHHLACCVMFLSWMMTNRKDLDDRWKDGNSSSK